MASQQDSRSLVAGIQLGLKREAVRGDACGGGFPVIDLKKPLQHFLKGVFDDGGKVVLTFPDSTYAQVTDRANNIRTAAITTTQGQARAPSTRTTKCCFCTVFSCCSCPKLGEEELDPDDESSPALLTAMSVEMVGVTITPMSIASLKRTIVRIFRNLPNPRNPRVHVVMLLDSSETQALTIRTGDVENAGQVYFESLNQQVDGAYLFFRVNFFSTQSGHELDLVTIWISFKTFLPIGITENDELFAELPQSTIFSAVPLSTGIDEPPSTGPTAVIDAAQPANTDPFTWLPDIVQNHSNEYFFRERSMGGDIIVIHPANSSVNRRVTRQEEIAVVADNNEWEFTIRPQMS